MPFYPKCTYHNTIHILSSLSQAIYIINSIYIQCIHMINYYSFHMHISIIRFLIHFRIRLHFHIHILLLCSHNTISFIHTTTFSHTYHSISTLSFHNILTIMPLIAYYQFITFPLTYSLLYNYSYTSYRHIHLAYT